MDTDSTDCSRTAKSLRARGPAALAPVAVLMACALLMGGCGTTSTAVKSDMPSEPARACSSSSPLKKSAGPAERIAAPKPSRASLPVLPVNEDGPRVRKFIKHYAYNDRRTMRKYLARAEKFLPMVRDIAKEHGMPEEIGYLFMLESGANPEARSPANAVGMWQFMPATARSYGLRVDSWVDERLDPEKSTRAAMVYLKDLYGRFGCWRLALSAYNSGENKLSRVLRREDTREYDRICSSRRLKRETREFWPKFQAIARIARDPKKYGFQPLAAKEHRKNYELVTVRGSYSFDTISEVTGVPAYVLRAFNPALIRKMTPARGITYAVRIPRGVKATLVKELETLPADPPSSHTVHTVRRGESVWKILRSYKISKRELANLNPDINFRKVLRCGAKLVVPKPDEDPPRSKRGNRVSLLH